MRSKEKTQKIKLSKGYIFFGLFVLLFTTLLVFVESKNGKFWTNDFRVYYYATQDFLQGNSPYEHNYGLNSGLFKYPPTTLFIFALNAWLPYFWAQIVHSLILALSFISGIILLHQFYIFQEYKRRMWVLYLLFFIAVVHLTREFHLGNINLILLALYSFGLITFLKNRPMEGSVYWSFMIILKPICLLVVVPFLLKKQWKPILIMGALGLLFLLIPAFKLGWSGNIEIWQGWLKAISLHGDYIPGENSLSYLTKHFIGIDSAWGPSFIVLGMLVLSILWINRNNVSDDAMELSTVFLAFVPNFFVTDTEHFLLSLPLFIVIIRKLLVLKNKLLWIMLTVLILAFAVKSNDLLGKDLSEWYSYHGILGIANLLLIIFYLVLSRNEMDPFIAVKKNQASINELVD